MKVQILGIMFIVVVVGLAVSCRVSVWNECRTTHSWVYCYHTVVAK